MTFECEQVAAFSVQLREASRHLIAGRDSAFSGALDALAFDVKAYLRGPNMTTKSASAKPVIVRTYSAGVHAGNLISRDGKEVVLANAYRIWSWQGALSLHSIATTGISGGKIDGPVASITLTEAIEIIEAVPAAFGTIVSRAPTRPEVAA